MTAMSIDTNIVGNDADTLGPSNACVVTTPGSSIVIDVTALGIPSSNPIIAFALVLNYDPSALSVSAASSNFLLTVAAGSSVADVSEPAPDSDGAFSAAAADTDPAAAEFGSGVLQRITFDISGSATPGTYDLTITDAGHGDPNNDYWAPNAINNARVAVGEPCPFNYTGDVDCGLDVTSVDALKVLRHNAGLSVTQNEPPPCPTINTDAGTGRLQGDVDCMNGVNAVDALKILRAVAALPVTQGPGCPPVAP
jgi:hypothetical protein